MKTLAIDSSMMGKNSVTKLLMQYFIKHNRTEIKYRDLVAENPTHLNLHSMANNEITDQTPVDIVNQIIQSQTYLNEFLESERIVISAPMYNFSVPSVLKSWIDRIMIAGKTFKYTEQGPVGMAGNKKIFILSSRGSEYESVPELKAMDHQENYLKTVFNFIGINDITFIRAEGVNMGEEKKQLALTGAYNLIHEIQ